MNISFNHADHLGDLRRGKKLRCTSCHARGEQEHFTLNKNVCFTCHFKGAEKGHSVTGCNVCHGMPRKIVEVGGFQFNHESYLKIGVDCSQCHIEVTRGNAEVEKKVCYKCHAERIEEFSNIEKIHNVHVTKNGVDCEECHNSIEHGKIKMISSLEANCENCHSLKHTPQRELYMGAGGKDVESIPNRMFAAQVSCEGCHLDLNGDGVSDLSEKKQACVKCHSEGYDRMLDKWIAGINETLNDISPSIDYARKLVVSAKEQGKDVTAEETYLRDAESNVNLVKEGRGAHNVDYALRLLENAANNVEGIALRLGSPGYKVNRGKLLTDDKEYCNMCHFAITAKKVEQFQGQKFPHETHQQFLQCTKCHSRPDHKKITVVKDDCENCHKNFNKIPENIKFGSINFPHGMHLKKKNLECSVCHANADFANIQIKKNACTNCHHKDKELWKDCSKCHPVQTGTYEGTFAGGKFDPDMMKSGEVKCEDCHSPNKSTISKPGENVCVGCHDASYRNTESEWTNEIKTKIKTVASLIENNGKSSLTNEEKAKVQFGKKLVSAIKSDGSGGIHNYMTISSLLDKSIKELKTITNK